MKIGLLVAALAVIAIGGYIALNIETRVVSDPAPPVIADARFERNDFIVTDSLGNTRGTSLPSDTNAFYKISPSKKFVLYGYGIGDGLTGGVYSVQHQSFYELPVVISTLKSFGWLEYDRLEFHVGCVTTECHIYRSTGNERPPWEVERID